MPKKAPGKPQVPRKTRAKAQTPKKTPARIGRRPKWDGQIDLEQLCEDISLGAYDYQAAMAQGVARETFSRWLNEGAKPKAPAGLKAFRHRVLAARALARTNAERRVFQSNPFNWLRFGPGREKADEPGWTDQVKIEGPSSPTVIHLRWPGEPGPEQEGQG